jgi:L,D-peptidoglycan transpeptidase YkuD (ErfK/YbiS/YcfS/YnhG family)
MELIVDSSGFAAWNDRRMRCAVGRSGVTITKREGDGATPAGRWPMRRVLYRADRLARPVTTLPAASLARSDGWCDDPAHPDYNHAVTLPHPARCERLWRRDRVYDLIVVLGYNDAPVRAERGSAIFLHVARRGYVPTEGCIALTRADLLLVLAEARPGDTVTVAST